jgi:hypothetical protein
MRQIDGFELFCDDPVGCPSPCFSSRKESPSFRTDVQLSRRSIGEAIRELDARSILQSPLFVDKGASAVV